MDSGFDHGVDETGEPVNVDADFAEGRDRVRDDAVDRLFLSH
jgi:hypothetical protein